MRPFSCVCVRSVAPVSSSPGVLLHAPETNVSRETPHVRRLPQAFSRPTEAPRPRPLRPPPGPARLARAPPRAPRSHPRPRPRARVPRIPASRPPGPARRPRVFASSQPRASRALVPRSRSRPGLRLLPACPPAPLASRALALALPPRAPRVHAPRLRPAPGSAPSPRVRTPPPLAGPARLTSRLLPRNPRSRLLHPSCSPVASPFPFVALPMPGLSKSKRRQLRFYQHLHSTSTFATQQLSGRLNDRLSTFTQVTGGFSPRNNREGALTRPHEASMVILGELNSLTGINET